MRVTAAVVAGAIILAGCGGGKDAAAGEAKDAAIAAAKAAYEKARAEGVDLADGPCLGVVIPDWVADVAHEPRQRVDDQAANQCEAYRSGEARHFVELDPEGELIRAR